MNTTPPVYSHSADFIYIDQALRARWPSFVALEAEMAAFVPRPKEDFEPRREAELQRLRELNPEAAPGQLEAYVDQVAKIWASPEEQFRITFARRLTTEYVTVVMLAHALCEALINAYLALGMAKAGVQDLFPLLERTDFVQKWLVAPMSFAPKYEFPRGTALNETLVVLSRERNALVHYKIELSIGGNKVLDGSKLSGFSMEEQIRWLRRYFNLPYDLVEFLQKVNPAEPVVLLFDRNPISP